MQSRKSLRYCSTEDISAGPEQIWLRTGLILILSTTQAFEFLRRFPHGTLLATTRLTLRRGSQMVRRDWASTLLDATVAILVPHGSTTPTGTEPIPIGRVSMRSGIATRRLAATGPRSERFTDGRSKEIKQRGARDGRISPGIYCGWFGVLDR